MKAVKRLDRSPVSKSIIIGVLVIALSTSVISVVRASSLTAPTSNEQTAPKAVDVDQKVAVEIAKHEAPTASQEKVASVADQSKITAEHVVASSESTPNDSAASNRKARAEGEKDKDSTAATKEAAETKSAESKSSEKSSEKVKSDAKTAGSSKSSKPTTKSGSKSKLNSNLGMVTSTGSGGPTHYSNHDAYSAIAEKHGAGINEASRKSEKRGQSAMQRFGGIQKAGGLNDVLNPFKGLTDSGLARSLGASMRSIMKGKYSVPAYVASALLGAVALLAFYESPISPLPVPPLPEPPVGRFPPEMPNISPNAQVPFRPNQQQQYNQQGYSNQRSFTNGLMGGYQQQQAQQVLFPGTNQNAQQRQMNVGTQQQATGPVQQLAANLVNLASVGKQQVAQRKSGPDYDQSSSRSFFGSGSGPISQKIGGPANQQQQKQNSILSFFGLGGGSSSSSAAGTSSQANSPANVGANSPAQTSGDQLAAAAVNQVASQAGGSPGSSTSTSSLLEPKGQASNGMSNSHVVNKVKSYFSRASVSPASGSSSNAGIPTGSNSNPYDQYQRMSFVQALLKDTAFLPAFLTSNRKSSTAPTSASNKISSLTSAFSPNPVPAARMQVDNQYGQTNAGPKQQQKQAGASTTSGLARVAHTLLETFTSGITQRNAVPSHDDNKKQAGEESYLGQPSLAASLITEIVSNYGASNAQNMDSASPGQQQQQQYDQQQAKSAASHQVTGQPESQVASGRSDDQEHHQAEPQKQANSGSQHASKQQQVAASPSSSSVASVNDNPQQAHVRKTRSIGLEYPIENNQNLALREQQHPSKASQINNVIDFVADSYSNNRMLFNFVMNQVGLSHAVPYVEQILAAGANDQHHH